ncbi:hypothetical protein [Streptomyces sp. NPDC059861]|uniref:hypothetical protein n=1 Tax=Streptomyces sp. NPDC059861 TaxID=3346974 RepID=UPI0036464B42
MALLSAAIPYTLDMAALRCLPPRTEAVLESPEPAVAGLAATVVLGEILTALQWVAIACVVAASIGAVYTPRKKSKRQCTGAAFGLRFVEDQTVELRPHPGGLRPLGEAPVSCPSRRPTGSATAAPTTPASTAATA